MRSKKASLNAKRIAALALFAAAALTGWALSPSEYSGGVASAQVRSGLLKVIKERPACDCTVQYSNECGCVY